MKRRGRIFAWSSVGLCLVVLVIGMWTSYDILRATWHARGFDSTDVAEVISAAEKVAEIGVVQSIPHILEALKKSRRSREARPDSDLVGDVEPLLEGALTSIVAKSGRASVSRLVEGLRDDDWHIRELSAELLGELGPEAKVAVPALKNALTDQSRAVRWRARLALDGIEKPVRIYRRHENEGRLPPPPRR
ncbi:MAG: HEAT repeat domain-containing protein [Planctomycetota bacterium]|nr:HEAT repeat domain-containing protein [Planctomycetota bacterium]